MRSGKTRDHDMRVLIITPLYTPAVGGAATHFSYVVPGLVQRDSVDHVVVLTEHMQGQPRTWTQDKLMVACWLPTRISVPQRPWLIHAGTYALTQAWFALHLRSLVRNLNVDLIHFHTRFRGPLFYRSLRSCGVPVVADLHDKLSDPQRLTGIADRLITCGDGVRRFAVEGGFPEDRVTMIPIPFSEPQRFDENTVAKARDLAGVGDKHYLLYIGDITANKGVYALLDAFVVWRKTYPDVKLVMAGTNREGTVFEDRLKSAGGVHYLGRVAHEQALCLMQGAEIVILPSRSEGLPRVILEALTLGTRVICPPGVPEFDRYLPGSVLPAVDPQSIVTLLKKVWGDTARPEYPFEFHKSDKVVDRLVQVYSSVLNG